MRRRLLILVLGLLAVVLMALGVPLAISQARTAASELFMDRFADVSRFASLAQRGPSADDQPLAQELHRYYEVYGIAGALLDPDGRIVVSSPPGLRLPDGGHGGWLSTALGGRSPEPPGAIWPWSSDPFLVAEPVIDGGDVVGVVVTVSSTTALRQQLWGQWGLVALGELLAMAACVLIAVRLTRWILRPVKRLDRAAHSIATGRLTTRVPVEDGPPELRQLSASLNQMADAVEDALERQRMFVSDASHQLRNLLNALLLQLEDLSLRLPEQWQADAEMATQEGRRLATMLERLLELAKAEQSDSWRSERVDLVGVVAERVAVWLVPARARGISIVHGGARDARVVADRIALVSALDVALDNAIKFSPDSSQVTVDVRLRGDRIGIVVRDHGEGLGPDELARVGHRFWRSRRHQNVPGTGLGLSIARAMLEPSGGRLHIAGAPGGGLQVEISLPASQPGTPLTVATRQSAPA